MNDDSSATYYRDNQGQLTYEAVNGTGNFYYYLFDGLGSVVGVTDDSGNLVASYQYDAFVARRAPSATPGAMLAAITTAPRACTSSACAITIQV